MGLAQYWKNIARQASGNALAQLIAVGGIPILTRIYSPEVFALQGIFVQVVIFLSAIVLLRYEYVIPLLKDQAEAVMISVWAIRVGCIITVFLTACLWLILLRSDGSIFGFQLSYLFLLAPITAFLVSISVMVQNEAQRLIDFKRSAASEVVSKMFYILSGVGFSALPGGVGLLLTTGVSALGKTIALNRYIIFHRDVKGLPDSNDITMLVGQYKSRSVGMILSNCILTAATLIPLIFIGAKYGQNSLGQYSLVISTIFLPSALIGSAVGSVFYQKAASYWNEDRKAEITRLWHYTLVKLIFLSAPIYLIIFLLSEWAYPFIFGEQWAQSGQIAKLISVSAFFSFLAGPLDRVTLILRIGYYLPLIHAMRLVAIISAVIFSEVSNASIDEFIVLFIVVMSFVYLVDIAAARVLVGLRVRHD